MRVSFDFDGVLSQLAWQTVAVGMLEHGEDVYVVTARCQEPVSYTHLTLPTKA